MHMAGLKLRNQEPHMHYKKGGIGHANLIYRPIKNLACGIKIMRGHNQVTNGAKGVAYRLQTMVKFEF